MKHDVLKKKALEDPTVKTEYDALEAEFKRFDSQLSQQPTTRITQNEQVMQSQTKHPAPTLPEVQQQLSQLSEWIEQTPVWQWKPDTTLFGDGTQIFLKLELFQKAGSFKIRGVLSKMMSLSSEEKSKGVIAVSAGNHAIAVAYASQMLGVSAKVVMPKTADPFRMERAKKYGCEIILVDHIQQAFDTMLQIQEKEGRIILHPFEGPHMALGSATLGLEFHQQVTDLEAVIVAIGGGGLCAGVSSAIKQRNPSCQVYAVEPTGANSMTLSLQQGSPQSIDQVTTIADSLGSPRAEEYSFSLWQQHVDKIVNVTDAQIAEAMKLMFYEMKLAVEPAGVASIAAAIHPLQPEISGKKVGIIVCGSNIHHHRFGEFLSLA